MHSDVENLWYTPPHDIQIMQPSMGDAPPVHGDVTGDGIVDVLDVVTLINKILNYADYEDIDDINQDGNVDIVDVVIIINIVLEVDS